MSEDLKTTLESLISSLPENHTARIEYGYFKAELESLRRALNPKKPESPETNYPFPLTGVTFVDDYLKKQFQKRTEKK